MTLMAAEVIVKPVISEKSMDETQRGKYTFRVHDDANKLMIKAAVEELFKVTVVDVNVLTTKAKEKSRNRKRGRIQGFTSPWKKAIGVTVSTTKAKEKSRNRRRGRQQGWTSPWKKAVVTLAAGQKIEFFEGI